MTRHRVPPGRAQTFLADAEAAVELLRRRPGFEQAIVGRATDDAELWVIATSWQDVGSFRRAMSAFEVRVGAVPLLAMAVDEPTAFERLLVATETSVVRGVTDRADDADWSGPSRDG